ncbi:MAG: NAD-glutamate dehydrogenase, partial [Gammaproteobacteria bacterium]|nr:NAD-glutamate dehydrogenase [Gammaproteobacteria bacterium]
MFATMNAASQKVVEKIELLIKKKVGKTKLDQLTSFIRQYFANVPSDELLNRSVENLCGSVLAQWALVEKRKPGEMKLRVFNPTLAEDGFESPHSIVIVSQDDMPFLVDTMIMSLQRLGINIHFLIHAGGIRVVRDKNGTLQKVLMPEDPVTKGESAEAPIFIEIDRQHGQDVDNFPKIEAELRSGLEDVRLAVEDFESMKGRVRLMIGALQASPKAAKLDSAELVESIAFLEWINDDHFTFLGAADYDLDGKGKAAQFEINPKTTLGILKAYKRYEEGTFLRGGYPLAQSSDHHPLIITKSSYRATVHRPAQMIIIRTPRFNQAGKLIGEHSIFGLYTSPTYHSDPRSIPIIRRKVEA